MVDPGIDLGDYYISVEWDVLNVPASRNEKFYPCCDEPYPDIFFNITMRRKTLFYTVNLIIPCVGISFLSILVFYLPSDSGEKVSLSISILLSLTVFFLLLAEIIPPTSLAVPLLGKYLLFTMILVTLSVMVTIGVLNINFRSPSTHKMAPWVKKVFIDILPKYLWVERPSKDEDEKDSNNIFKNNGKVSLSPPIPDNFSPRMGNRFDKYGFEVDGYDIPAVPPSRYNYNRYGDAFIETLSLPPHENQNYSNRIHHRHSSQRTFEHEIEEESYSENRGVSKITYIAHHMSNVDDFEEVI